MPNYKLTGKSFDVQHLDKFMMRYNQAEAVQIRPELVMSETEGALTDEILTAAQQMTL